MKNDDLPKIESPYPQAFYIRPASYAKGKYQVTTYDSKDGWKGPAGNACDEVGARWVNRGAGYMMSSRQVRRFIEAYERIIAEWAAKSE